MAKKNKGKVERLRVRKMKRRVTQIIEVVFVSGFLLAEISIGSLANAPDWFGSPAYYGLVFAILIIGFAVLWFVAGASEKNEIDELEERMEQLFEKQTKAIDRLTKEIRKERKMWYAKFNKQDT